MSHGIPADINQGIMSDIRQGIIAETGKGIRFYTGQTLFKRKKRLSKTGLSKTGVRYFPEFIFFLISMFCLLCLPMTLHAMSPGIVLPECFSVSPMLKGEPKPGSRIEIGYRIKSIIGQAQVFDIRLWDAHQKKMAEQPERVLEKDQEMSVTAVKNLPENKCTYTFNLSFKARLPEKELKNYIYNNYPGNMADEYIREFPFGRGEEFNFSNRLYIDRFQAFFAEGISVLKSAMEIEGNFFFYKDFRISSDLNKDIAKLKDLERLKKVVSRNKSIKGEHITNIDRDIVIHTLSSSSHYASAAEYNEALSGLRKISSILPRQSIDEKIVFIECLNNIQLLKLKAILFEKMNDENRKKVLKGFLAEFDNIVELIQSTLNKKSLSAKDGQSTETHSVESEKMEKLLPYILHNRALIETGLDDKESALRDLKRLLTVNEWMFESKKIMQAIAKQEFSFFKKNAEKNNKKNAELSLSRPDISGQGYSNNKKGLKSSFTGSKWYLIPVFSLLIILIFLVIGRINKKF
jgi:hypothetical protein